MNHEQTDNCQTNICIENTEEGMDNNVDHQVDNRNEYYKETCEKLDDKFVLDEIEKRHNQDEQQCQEVLEDAISTASRSDQVAVPACLEKKSQMNEEFVTEKNDHKQTEDQTEISRENTEGDKVDKIGIQISDKHESREGAQEKYDDYEVPLSVDKHFTKKKQYEDEAQNQKLQENTTTTASKSNHVSIPVFTEKDCKMEPCDKPGKPSTVGQVHLETVCLVWEPPKELYENCTYQMRYKEVEGKSKWKFHPELMASSTITLSNLRSDTEYIFQVRMVNDEIEGPYSETSDPVQTIQSAAQQLLNFTYDVSRSDVDMLLKKIPLQENPGTRNELAKTRKLVIGEPSKTYFTERTIMLVGATGTGKSTLVDGMVNYILGVNWNDKYRLTLVDLEDEERKRDADQAVSQTQWITCYTMHPMRGSRLNYSLNIIDTPGFGDTRGIDRDKEIIDQIRTLFSREDDTGVLYIDAVCFLIKAPDARLTPTQMYIFNSIMSLFGQDIEENICMLVTFADGKRPPVLSALKSAKLPHEQYFPFNNSGLFAENTGENVSCFSPMFWDMGCKSFQMFFDKLTKMETKSLRQTRDVLSQREQIELTMDNLLPKLDAGLNKIEELRVEIRILEDYKTQIDENSDFTYTVTETEQKQIDLPKGQHVTNCLNCHMTCHKNCIYANDEDKKKMLCNGLEWILHAVPGTLLLEYSQKYTLYI